MDPHPHLELGAVGTIDPFECGDHLNRALGHCGGMVVALERDPSDEHVTVADCLDLFDPMLLDDMVEGGEDLIEHRDQIGGARLPRHRREATQVGKQHRDDLVPVRDRFFPPLQPPGDGRREDVEEEPLRLLPFPLHELLLGLELDEPEPLQIAEPLLFQRGRHAGPQQREIRRLGEVIFGPGLDALHRHVDLVGPGDDDHRQSFEIGGEVHRRQHLEPRHHRHLHVEEHQVEGGGVHLGHGIRAVERLDDIFKADLSERLLEHGAHRPAVIDEEHLGLCEPLASGYRLGDLRPMVFAQRVVSADCLKGAVRDSVQTSLPWRRQAEWSRDSPASRSWASWMSASVSSQPMHPSVIETP